jgi:hypothetical protein
MLHGKPVVPMHPLYIINTFKGFLYINRNTFLTLAEVTENVRNFPPRAWRHIYM